MTVTTKKDSKPEVKAVELTVHDVEIGSVIVNVNGWRMRVYFEENTTVVVPNVGQKIIAKYTGDIEDAHSVRFEKLK